MKLIVATRPSLLAYTQTLQTVELLKSKNPDIEFEIVKFSTQGDKVADKSLTAFGGTGIFVKELENAIIKGKAHFAIHSLKDVPAYTPKSLFLASFVKREDPRDIILMYDVRSTMYDLKLKSKIVNLKSEDLIEYLNGKKAIIGTGSPRRIVQLSHIFPDAEFKDLRGNIDTRLRKLAEGNYDAIILAAAGLKRLGYLRQEQQNTTIKTTLNFKPETLNLDIGFLSFDLSLPAIGQGIIALECRRDDVETIKILRTVNDINTEIAVKAERGFMIEMEGNCKFPLAAHAEINSVQSSEFVVQSSATTNYELPTPNLSVSLTAMVGNPATKQILKDKGEWRMENGTLNFKPETLKFAEELGINLALKMKPRAKELGIL